MKHQKTLLALVLIASALATSNAQASLVDRGNGMLYDNVLNVTWLQDANYAHTSGYALALGDGTGEMSWKDATNWAANLIYGGYSDWRLASNAPVNGTSFTFGGCYDGTCDIGYNITSPKSEMAYMYYVNLGLKGWLDSSVKYQPDFGIFGNGTLGYGLQNNAGLVHNLQSYTYWSGSESMTSFSAFAFDNGDGLQYHYLNSDSIDINGNPPYTFYAWAVRPGDVSAVPVPGAVWLFGSALLGFLGFKKRKAA